MLRVVIANIVIENNQRSAIAPGLYCKGSLPALVQGKPIEENTKAVFLFPGAGSYDFMTYFNSFSNLKWKEYTNIGQVYLHLETKGASYSLEMTGCPAFPYIMKSYGSEGFILEVPASDDWTTLDIPLPLSDDVLLSFLIESDGAFSMRDSYYYTEVQESVLNDVELAIVMTTFKKEEYVIPNINLIKTELIENESEWASHLTLHVVDNGRTLEPFELEAKHVKIHPNPNVGGSGGYARGMIEAMEQDTVATHVILMDDDVELCAESLFRTFSLLRLLKSDYADWFISGAMFEISSPEVQFEDVGKITELGILRPHKGSRNMNELGNLISNETIDVNISNAYAGWWYCVIPTNLIKRYGLPLPLFVRTDDVEYSLRCGTGIITMAGICIWHEAFHARYDAAIARYQVIRNSLIANAVSGIGDEGGFMFQFEDGLRLELKKFNYEDAMLTIKAFEDFLRGPDFIMTPGVAEERFLSAHQEAETLRPITELSLPESIQIDENSINSDVPRTRLESLSDLITFNGQRLPYPGFLVKNAPTGVREISYDGWEYRPGKIRGADSLIALDIQRGLGAVRYRDNEKFKEVQKRYKKAKTKYKKNRDAIRREYAEKKTEMTSVSFWKHYLGIDTE